MKHDVHNIKQSKDWLQIWWHTFQREKTIKIWALKNSRTSPTKFYMQRCSSSSDFSGCSLWLTIFFTGDRKWSKKLKGQTNLAQLNDQLTSTATIQIALRWTMKLRSFSGSQSFILQKFTLRDAFWSKLYHFSDS